MAANVATKQAVSAAEERAQRSVFVGNIPYEATEEQLKEIFIQAGPVVSFRLVYDRETGKPKGYGFCEYQDVETAQSAMRNLNNHDFNGRPLRVGVAAGEQNKDENKSMQQAIGGPPVESPYGDPVEPTKAPEAISKAVASLPPEQMFELMKQMKMCIQNNPNEARNMLLQNPQLAYALLQAQIIMKIVDPQVALAMLHRQTEQIPPLLPNSGGEPSQISPGMPMDTSGPPASVGLPMPEPRGPPDYGGQFDPRGGPGMGPGGPGRAPGGPMGPGPMGGRGPRGGLLGDRPGGPPGPMDPMGGPGGYMDRGPRDMPPRDMGHHGPMGGPRGPGPDQYGRDMGGPPGRGPGGPRGDPRDPRSSADPRSVDPRAGRGPPPASMAGPPPRSMGMPMQARPPAGGPPGPGPSASAVQGIIAGGGLQGLAAGGGITSQDQEKAALIMQVLQLSDDQIAMLPPEQRASILILKDQIARSAGQGGQ